MLPPAQRPGHRQDAARAGTSIAPAAGFFLIGGGENAVAGGLALPAPDPRTHHPPHTHPPSLSRRRNSPLAERAWPQALPTSCAKAPPGRSRSPRPARGGAVPRRAGPGLPPSPPGAPEGASPARAPRRRSPTVGSGGSPRSPARC